MGLKSNQYRAGSIFHGSMHILQLHLFREIKRSLKLWKLLSSTSPHACPAHPWEVGGTISQHGVQTNALVKRGKLVPRGLIPLRETAGPRNAARCPTCSALGELRKQCNGGRSFPCTRPTSHLGSYTPVSTSVRRRGVLEITGSCDRRKLSTYQINKTYFYQLTCSPSPKAEAAQQ